MSRKTCLTDCSQNYCPFVQDPKNPRRYVCLKCGLERSLDRRDRDYREDEGDRSSAAILALLSVIVLLILI
ncbi:MAG: hypothetical protein J7545_03255 [Roseofilum sp. SBFL]|uniref:hypothetical protein n=1 Tax=unclassified Roseofilum TaxID=2620099 RepID=UPI001B197264|nr:MULTISPECIES: hypothetical protein [unclassified Roseofilum]MBP0014142.1 hypothetical protein [Roseofilum sp. SID3]MBP0025097.1 hypothetical protein [Roseofilum sp. SID2]MBP0040983.1 hypothetical protein [Roseofilum sp. SBFL]